MLDHPSLLICTAECITEEEFFCAVLSEQIGSGLTELVLSMGQHLRLRMDATENEARPLCRILLALSLWVGECFSDRLVIRELDRNHPEAYTVPTQAFYLFMQ